MNAHRPIIIFRRNDLLMSAQEDFAAAGAMFRGDTPRHRLRRVGSDAVYSVASKSASVTINSLRLDNVGEAAQKFVLKVALAGDNASSEGQYTMEQPSPFPRAK